jgi:hypothetical protein
VTTRDEKKYEDSGKEKKMGQLYERQHNSPGVMCSFSGVFLLFSLLSSFFLQTFFLIFFHIFLPREFFFFKKKESPPKGVHSPSIIRGPPGRRHKGLQKIKGLKAAALRGQPKTKGEVYRY